MNSLLNNFYFLDYFILIIDILIDLYDKYYTDILNTKKY